MTIVWILLGWFSWWTVGSFFIRHRAQKELARSARLEAVTGPQDAIEEDLVLLANRWSIFALHVGCTVDKLCWPYTYFLSADDAVRLMLRVAGVLSTIRFAQRFPDGRLQEIHDSND